MARGLTQFHQITQSDGRSKAMVVADRSNRAPCNFHFRDTLKAPRAIEVEGRGRCSNPSVPADFHSNLAAPHRAGNLAGSRNDPALYSAG